MTEYIKKNYKKYNLEGKKFGYLTVLFDYYNPDAEYSHRHWCHCLCNKCGNEKDYSAGILKSGDVISCNCAKHDRDIKDLLNKRFGKLLVTSFAYMKNHKAYWNCKCDCGNTIITPSNGLSSNHTKSCGKCSERELVGQTFGKLTVLSTFYNMEAGNKLWCHCICNCTEATKVDVGANALRSGHTKSCGCYRKDHPSRMTHGMANTRFYSSWYNMNNRCSNKSHNSYKDYGARGIIICDRWKDSFDNFKEDMYESYLNHVEEFGEDNTSIDRIDVDGNYEPSNCKWSTREEQANNRRTNHLLTYGGETHNMKEWATILNINPKSLYSRIVNLGWSAEKALATPIEHN